MPPQRLYDIDSLLDGVITLPSLPGTLAQVIEITDSPTSSLSDVAKVIALDPSLAMKTLRLVNSAYYGRGQDIATVEHAVVMLGPRVIRNLVFTATVFNVMKKSAGQFLNHSIACGVAMRSLVESGLLPKTLGTGDEVFIHGLFHDIGKVVLQEFLSEAYAWVMERATRDHLPWFQAEREVIGVDHAEVGAQLAAQWKLPSSLVDAIAGHHEIERAGAAHRQAAAALALADYLVNCCGFSGLECPLSEPPNEVWSLLSLTVAEVPALCKAFFEKTPHITSMMQLAS